MNRKICHVFFDEYPKDSRVRRYANTSRALGYCNYIVCTRSEGSKLFEVNANGDRIFRIPIGKRRSTFARRLYEYMVFEMAAFVLAGYVCLRHGVRLFQVHTLPDFLVFSCVIPKLVGGRIFLDFHELFPEFMMQHAPSLSWNSPIIRLLLLQERLSFAFADEVIIFSDPAKAILASRQKSGKEIRVVMNAVDRSELPAVEKQKTENFRIVYNGTINFNLNLSMVVEAMALIKQERYDLYRKVEFHLYGDGPDLQTILDRGRELNVDAVHYRGRFKFADMMKELGSASVCILPPKQDIYSDLYYSLKLTEMIYLNIPVIATRLNTYLYYYPEGCLLYFNSGDTRDLADKICYLIEHPSAQAAMSAKAASEYEKYSWEIMKDRYINLLQSCQ